MSAQLAGATGHEVRRRFALLAAELKLTQVLSPQGTYVACVSWFRLSRGLLTSLSQVLARWT